MKRVASPPGLEPRPTDAHKASVGRVLVVGGSRGMAGAPALAALGALRAGAGLVRVAVPRSIQGVAASFRPETTTMGLPESPGGGLDRAAAEAVLAVAEGWDALVLGPGAGREEATLEALRSISLGAPRAVVIDADALFAWNGRLEALRARRAATVLTPHEGEAARLLGISAEAVRGDRSGTAALLAALSGGVAVLKGPGTLVHDGARAWKCPSGGPVLASGGTGDLLAGAIAALLAGLPGTGGDSFGAASVAVAAHVRAADRVAKGRDRGVLASEIGEALSLEIATRVRGRRKRG